MKKLSYLLVFLLITGLLVSACDGAAPEEPVVEEEKFLACQVTDVGGIDDKSFNATAWKGVEDAVAAYGIEGKYLESQQQTDYEANINAFIEEECDIILPIGYLLADATLAGAEANPDVPFAIVDVNYITADNIYGSGYAMNEGTFLAGYLAAGMTETGVVATYGGINIPPVTIFMDGFVMGVREYNKVHGTDVQVLGWDPEAADGLFTGNFESTDDGRTMGESLVDEGADVIMSVAGPVGAGTLAVLEDLGSGYLIGVDIDWTIHYEAQAEYILASAYKGIDKFVTSQIEAVMNDTFGPGNLAGNLENGYVDLIYSFANEDKIPQDLKDEIAALKAGIIAGEVVTVPAAPAEEEAVDLGTVVVGFNAEYPPFENVDEDGNFVGFDVDLMTAIAEEAGFEFEWVNTRWDGIFVALASGEFDAVISAATITAERAETVNFSDPYFDAGQAITVRADETEIETPEDLAGKRVGVQLGTTGDIWLTDETEAEVVRYDENTLAFQALANGDVDAAVADNTTAIELVKANPEMNLKFLPTVYTKEQYGIAVNMDRTDLLAAINAGLAAVKESGKYDEIYNKYFGTE
jgi:basic membrane protein A